MNESALCVSLDVLRMQEANNESWSTLLTLGSNSKVLVLERAGEASGPSSFTQVTSIEDVSDNVSCVRSLFDSESKQVVTVFGTYNGRVNS